MHLILSIGLSNGKAKATIDFETSLVSKDCYNICNPCDQVALFSLKGDLIVKAEFFYKKRFKYTIKSQNTISKVIHEIKERELHSGNSDKIVTNPKQPIAIALSEAEHLKKQKKGRRQTIHK